MNNRRAWALAVDTAVHSAGLCARRAGKTYTAVATALATGEAKPGSISIIISLNLKQLRRLYWDGGPSGIWALARKYKLNLRFNDTQLKWTHENGSYGILLGCEDDEQLEVIRGLEADLYIVDESQGFPPARLRKLIVDIITPQRVSRKGRLMLIGTPGPILAGPFYQATCRDAINEETDKRPYCVTAGETDEWGRNALKDRLWSLHEWSLEDNSAMPHQWQEALLTKQLEGWADDNPTWLREYRGKWVAGGDGLVYRYANERSTGKVTWVPSVTKDNPTGLPEEGAPWRLVGGLDLGFEDHTAFVVAAYSQQLRQLRHVWDYSAQHMLPDDVGELVQRAIDEFGNIEVIYADAASLGKMIVRTLVEKYRLPVEKADKREKNDYIELVNSAFSRGEIKIIEGTTLEHQLLTNAWDYSTDDKTAKQRLARSARLQENKAIPNDSCDAFLYMFRGSLHHFGTPAKVNEPAVGTPEWFKKWEKDQLKKARESFRNADNARLGDNKIKKAPGFVHRALERGQWKKSIPGPYPTFSSS